MPNLFNLLNNKLIQRIVDNLSIVDIINLSNTCKVLHACSNTMDWKAKCSDMIRSRLIHDRFDVRYLELFNLITKERLIQSNLTHKMLAICLVDPTSTIMFDGTKMVLIIPEYIFIGKKTRPNKNYGIVLMINKHMNSNLYYLGECNISID